MTTSVSDTKGKPLKTVHQSPPLHITGLKPGVNESYHFGLLRQSRATAQGRENHWRTERLALSYAPTGVKEMYCSSCGTAVTEGLSYCNRCGAKVDAKVGSAKLAELSPNFLVASIVWITIVGLVAIIALLALLKKSPEIAGVILAFSVLCFLLVLATEILFIWLLLRSKTKAKGAPDPSQLRGPALRELDPGQAHMLHSPTVSVTDHTTRTLEPIQNQRKTE